MWTALLTIVLLLIYIVLLGLLLSFQRQKIVSNPSPAPSAQQDLIPLKFQENRRPLRSPKPTSPFFLQTQLVNIQNQTSEELILDISDPISDFLDSSEEPIRPDEARLVILSTGNVLRLSTKNQIQQFCGPDASTIQTNFESLLPANQWGTVDVQIRSRDCPDSGCVYLYFASGVLDIEGTTFKCPTLDRPTRRPPQTTTPIVPARENTFAPIPRATPILPILPIIPSPTLPQSYQVRIENKASLPDFFVHVFAHLSNGKKLYEYKTLPIQTGTDRFDVFPGSYIDITGYRTNPILALNNPCGGSQTKAKRDVKYRLTYDDLNPHELGSTTPNVNVLVDMHWCKKHSCYFISLSGDIRPETDGIQTDCA